MLYTRKCSWIVLSPHELGHLCADHNCGEKEKRNCGGRPPEIIQYYGKQATGRLVARILTPILADVNIAWTGILHQWVSCYARAPQLSTPDEMELDS
jgi:hypothetical protein